MSNNAWLTAEQLTIVQRAMDLLREVSREDDRWGYWAAYRVMQDDYRDKVRAVLSEWEEPKP